MSTSELIEEFLSSPLILWVSVVEWREIVRLKIKASDGLCDVSQANGIKIKMITPKRRKTFSSQSNDLVGSTSFRRVVFSFIIAFSPTNPEKCSDQSPAYTNLN